MSLRERIERGQARVGVIGLGYVGLPLAAAFGRHMVTVGFDVDARRIAELAAGKDRTGELASDALAAAGQLRLTDEAGALRGCDLFIVTVPTPVDTYRRPDLRPLESASRTVAGVLGRDAVVVYESTVYPGCTEEICVPILEQGSGLRFNVDFFAGYSPERINPGDKVHTLAGIVKVVSGSTPETTDALEALYGVVVTAGTYRAPSIRVAEAAKVIENSQRDINIAFVNELSMIFQRLGIDTLDVLEAAGTKWNFLPFRPGLVGGHCIGVDPYYLTHKAQEIGYHPQIILAGRRLNDDMGREVAQRVVKLMLHKGRRVAGERVLVLGMTFKENCPDVRNSRVIDVIRELTDYGCVVDVVDPYADPRDVEAAYGLTPCRELPDAARAADYGAVVLAVAHAAFEGFDAAAYHAAGAVVFDVKGRLDRRWVDGRL